MALGWLKQGIAAISGATRMRRCRCTMPSCLRARAEHWYLDGAVPDTVDGRFDMIAAVLSVVLIRLEAEPEGVEPAARLTERFVTDMDGQLRELGIGDIVVGKHIGKMMAMLGGRLTAYREGLAGDRAVMDAALVRNLYRGAAPRIRMPSPMFGTRFAPYMSNWRPFRSPALPLETCRDPRMEPPRKDRHDRGA